jgi:TolB-like protein
MPRCCSVMLAVLALALSFPAAPAAMAQDVRPTVAVMYFGNGAIGKANEELAPLSKGIADMLITELSANPAIRVLERDQLEQLMKEQDAGSSGRVDPETAARLGKILGAHHMIFGGFVTDTRGAMRIDARAVSVETSQIVHVETVSGTQEELLSLVNELAGKLNRGMKLPDIPRDVRQASVERAKKVPLEAAMLYSRALAAKDGGNAKEAVMLLQRSLATFPEYEPARRELAKLTPSAGGPSGS